MATWEDLYSAFAWRPIPGCPGRYVLVGRGASGSPPDLAFGVDEATSRFDSELARDRVFVVVLAAGGLISYQHADGSFVHTLNSPEGFARKLAQLGIRVGSDL